MQTVDLGARLVNFFVSYYLESFSAAGRIDKMSEDIEQTDSLHEIFKNEILPELQRNPGCVIRPEHAADHDAEINTQVQPPIQPLV